MDKLQPQTVYVPVVLAERMPPADNRPIVIINDEGRPSTSTGYQESVHCPKWHTHWLEKLPGVYPLTGKELADLFKEYAQSDTPLNYFLKSKGIEI